MAEIGSEESPADAADLSSALQRDRDLVNAALERALPVAQASPQRLHEAMRYSVLAGGKRLRPILVLSAGRACGCAAETLMPAACAVELIHTYSLIHDDLPAFDDDDMRRGRATNHVVFGEAVAILAGDALQTRAFELLAAAALAAPDPTPWLSAIDELARAAGSIGMAGGQCLDLEAEGQHIGLTELRSLHAAKTGALLTASVRIGALVGGADQESLEGLTRYGQAIGLAFQIVDDILDVEGSLENLGKRPGSDEEHEKSTYPALLGIDRARAEARDLCDQAIAALAPLGDRDATLAALARYVIDRSQ